MKIDIGVNISSKQNYSVYIDELNTSNFDSKVAIITNETVSKLHLKTLQKKIKAKEQYVVTLKDGEEYKNLETIEYILDELFQNRLDRKSILLAFGGGVVGDMTGFAASIYQRGIKFIQIPTTLLSQVDASVGGKTGVNNKFGKNLIGTFHQPAAVYCESEFLKTLPKREFNAGVSEIIKMAVMFDKEFFKWLQNADLNKKEDLQNTIKKCIEIKAKVVEEDEKESGVRAVLNYGHTFAHVIEHESGYGTFLHGEAVSMGIVMANELAKNIGLITNNEAAKVEELLKKHNLPTKYKIKDVNKFYDAFFLDKKSSNSKITFILPDGIGKYKIVNNIKEEIVKSVLKVFN